MLEETLRYLGIAFVSSAALIVMSKIILQHLIRRPADYYNAAEIYQEEMMLNAAGFSITEEIETNPEGELTDETIDVEPQISVKEAVAMDLIELDQIPEKYIEAEAGDITSEESDDIAADNSDIPSAGGTIDDADEIPDAADAADLTEENNGEEVIANAGETENIIESGTESEPKEDSERETFADIRKQLELAYEKSQAEAAELEDMPGEPEAADIEPGLEPDDGDSKVAEKIAETTESTRQDENVSKKTRKRLPSMRMRRDQLIEIAKSYGIEIPDDATKRAILGLIGEVTEIDDTQPDRSRSRGRRRRNKKADNSNKEK